VLREKETGDYGESSEESSDSEDSAPRLERWESLFGKDPAGWTFGEYLAEIREASLLTAEQEIEFARRIERGDENAKSEFIRANLPLVVSIIKRFRGLGLDCLDLISEGNLGLMEAVERFEWRMGNKFSTHATPWIEGAIKKALTQQSRGVGVKHLYKTALRLRQREWGLAQELGHTPTLAERAADAGLSVEEVAEADQALEHPVSLDTPLDEDDSDGTTLAGTVVDSPSDREEAQLREGRIQAVEAALQTLTPQEQQVVTLHYGLGGGERLALHEVARELHCDEEHVRQILEGALKSLRESKSSHVLKRLLS